MAGQTCGCPDTHPSAMCLEAVSYAALGIFEGVVRLPVNVEDIVLSCTEFETAIAASHNGNPA